MDAQHAPDTTGDAPVGIPLLGRMDRRRFLVTGGIGAGAIAATAWLRPSWFRSTSTGATEPTSTGNTIVYVFLRGAADGLSFLAPLGDSTYQAARPGVAIPDAAALFVDSRFGLHPGAVRLKGFLDEGRLALVPAAGSPEANRSHFYAQDVMDKGTPGQPSTSDGWLGRYLARSAGSTGSTESILRGVGIGTSLTTSLRGGGEVATPNLQSLALNPASSASSAQLRSAIGAMYASANHALLRDRASAAVGLVDLISPIAASASPPTGWPNGFGDALWPIAKLIGDGYPVEVATADLGGWDEHHAMGSTTDATGSQRQLVTGLDTALGAFFDHLGARASTVTVVVTTEFGRRIAINGSGGTDHGRGMVMMAIGGGVSPGVKGTWPGLVDTDNGDVRVMNDYRAVLSEVLAKRMRACDLTTVFPGFDTSASSWLGVMV
jgi:uncharacterized protein (DUF1501 family)